MKIYKTQLNFNIPIQLRIKLDEHLKKTGQSLSDFITQAIIEKFQRLEEEEKQSKK